MVRGGEGVVTVRGREDGKREWLEEEMGWLQGGVVTYHEAA